MTLTIVTAGSRTLNSFWAKVDQHGPVVREELGPCWVWTGRPNTYGYGHFYEPATHKELYAHRFAYATFVGPIPAGQCVLHECDTPPCVRPDHLHLGSPVDNAAERVARDRTPKGESVSWAKLTESDVLEIRRLRADGHKLKDLAAKFGVGHSTIYRVANRVNWRHIA